MMIRWLERYFPEFTQLFSSFGKMALAVLECTPLPSDLHQKQPDEVLSLYRKVEGLKSPKKPKAVRLIGKLQK
jgi:transposase